VVIGRPSHGGPPITCTENFVKFGHTLFDIFELTDRHTDTHTLIAILCSIDDVKNIFMFVLFLFKATFYVFNVFMFTAFFSFKTVGKMDNTL